MKYPPTPADAIRAECRKCIGMDSWRERNACTVRADACLVWPYRKSRGFDASRGDEKVPRSKVIRKECLNCQGGSPRAVKVCPISDCPLWVYRIGRGLCFDPEGRTVVNRKEGAAHVG